MDQSILIPINSGLELGLEHPQLDLIDCQPKEASNIGIVINNVSQEFAIMITLQENLNLRIGMERWKKYISSIFWYYLSMPINFTITLFTAISSGQVGTQASFLSNGTLFALLFTSFILSTINTFFRLKETTEANYVTAQQFEKFAMSFQDIYFTSINSDVDVVTRLTKYKNLQSEINLYSSKTDLNNINYLTECIYSCCKKMCFQNKLKLVKISERFWVLDGKKKSEAYHKKYLMVDMKNFKLDVDKINDLDFENKTVDQLISPDYVSDSKSNTNANAPIRPSSAEHILVSIPNPIQNGNVRMTVKEKKTRASDSYFNESVEVEDELKGNFNGRKHDGENEYYL